jgi:hypothetical protein
MRWFRGFAVAMTCLAAVVSFLPARAQEQKQVDITITGEQAQKKSVFQSLSEFGSYGGAAGVMKVLGGDLGPDSQARPVLQSVFRYRFNEAWVGTTEFGFGWNSFRDQGDSVLTFHFGTLGAARRISERFGFEVRAAAGAGFYRWNYKFKGKSLRDPETQRFYRGIAPGGYLGLEGERRITRHVTLLTVLQGHYVTTSDQELFHSLFDRNHAIMSWRLGANYHFSPYEGILWERKTKRTIRLTSGKAGS